MNREVVMGANVLHAAYDLKDEHPEAEDIRLDGEPTLHRILRRHVPAGCNLTFLSEHLHYQKNVAGLEVSVDNRQPRILVKIEKTLSYSLHNLDAFAPI
ncbi:hypothetical protein Taro_019630 [Colocasia esculenta]|uniref:Uncharacterized protein n=1 Tax=Colocasia esculenta TaxID=4460 RepID=A0A843UXB2_COLES|nr:hypothetical protein [Colocasia esculenta]